MKKIIIGVCIFDDPKAPRSGYSSMDGSDPTYIAGYHELSSDILWVTNLEFPVFKELNLLRLRHLAQAQYFRTSIRMLQIEYGITEHKQLAQFLSKMFSRVAQLGLSHFGADPANFNYRYHQALSSRLHIPGMVEPVQGLDQNAIQLVIDHSTQENQAMAGVKRPDRSSPISFCFPREAYSQWLMTRTYPVSNVWKSDNLNREFTIGTRDGKKIASTDSFVKTCGVYFKNHARATFFRISVQSHEPSHRAFASFASGSKEPRAWVAWPELLELLEYSVVTVYESVSVASGSIQNYLPDFCKQTGFGISECLLLENLYVALASPINRKNTALGAYIRAYDRAACGRAAAYFHNAGLCVGSYSSGRVVLLLSEGQRERASKLALDFGLLPPLEMSQQNE
jgi:hypothetical protein